MRPIRRAALILTGAITFAVALVILVVRLVIPPPVPVSVPVPPPLGPALTRHLVLVIVDGLRYDVATDPSFMPDFARRMSERRSAEIWSGVVSMTSSAIMTYGTGQRGDVEQIIRNEAASPVVHNDLIKNARGAGLVTACTGDRTWFRLYPGRWDLSRPDPSGVAIDVDYNAEIFAAARDMLRHDPRPNLAIFHFVTPDHQAHAYGVFSKRYRAHIQGFDRDLSALIAEIPPDTTIIVTSDHGAADSGTHGTDTPVQRRSPLVAWGPGIAPRQPPGAPPERPLDQIDLPGTLAALLGVPPPAHGRGHVLVDLLDLDDDRRAALACADLARLAAYTRATLGDAPLAAAGVDPACAAAPSPRERITLAAAAASALDSAFSEAHITGRFAWLAVAIVLAAALALAAAMVRDVTPRLPACALGLSLVALAVFAIFIIERLPYRLPDTVRAIGYIAANVALFIGVLRPRAAAALLDRRPLLGAALLPGLLAISETKTTQPESFVVAVVIAGFALTAGLPRATATAPLLPAGRLRARAPRLLLVALLLLTLTPLVYRESAFLPKALVATPERTLALAVASILAFAWLRHRAHAAASRALPLPALAALTALAAACLVLRRMAPAPICIAGWLGLGVLAPLVFFRGGRLASVELLALGSYAWVSRDAEIPFLLVTYVIAAEVGEALRGEGSGGAAITPSSALLVATFLFAWTYVQRVGVQLGLDFSNFDWGAGAFRQENVSIVRIGAALIYKHGLARAAVLAAVLAPLGPRLRVEAARGLFLAELARAAMLATLLYVCRDSYWTALRAVGDVPHALVAVIVAAAAYLAATAAAGRTEAGAASAPAPAPVPEAAPVPQG